MGLDQSRVLSVGTLVPKDSGHNFFHSTLLVISPLEQEATPLRWLPKVRTSGLFPCNTWSTRHTLARWLQT